jgi:hypothetical protein
MAAMLVFQTKESKLNYLKLEHQHGGCNVMCKRSIVMRQLKTSDDIFNTINTDVHLLTNSKMNEISCKRIKTTRDCNKRAANQP